MPNRGDGRAREHRSDLLRQLLDGLDRRWRFRCVLLATLAPPASLAVVTQLWRTLTRIDTAAAEITKAILSHSRRAATTCRGDLRSGY